jgi:hypothetical protein
LFLEAGLLLFEKIDSWSYPGSRNHMYTLHPMLHNWRCLLASWNSRWGIDGQNIFFDRVQGKTFNRLVGQDSSNELACGQWMRPTLSRITLVPCLAERRRSLTKKTTKLLADSDFTKRCKKCYPASCENSLQAREHTHCKPFAIGTDDMSRCSPIK